MSAMLTWIAGFAALVALAVGATSRARTSGHQLERASTPLVAAALLAALAALAGFTFGGAAAQEGEARRLREGLEVVLTLETLRLPARDTLTVGFDEPEPVAASPTRLALAGPGPAALFTLHRRAGAWQLELPPEAAWLPLERADHRAVASALGRSGRAAACAARTAPASATHLEGAVVWCGTDERLAVLVRRRGPSAALELGIARGSRWLPPRLLTTAGALVYLDGDEAALPGVRTWSAGPRGGGSWLLPIPADPRRCDTYRAGAPGLAENDDGGCRLHLPTSASAPELTLHATPRSPDAAGVWRRGALAAAQLCLPAGLLLLALAGVRGSRRRADLVAPALRLAVLSAALAALVLWRLLWAYRVDALLDEVRAGWRVFDNQLAAVWLGAALAGLAARLPLERALRSRRRLHSVLLATAPFAAWLGYLAACFAVATLAGSSPLSRVIERPLVSAALALASAALVALPAATARLANRAAKLRGHDSTGAVIAGTLLAIAIAALAGRTWAPHFVLGKLALAYGAALAGAAAVAGALEPARPPWQRLGLLGASALACGALLTYDTGATLAVTGVGLTLALALAGHDALYRDSAAPRLGVLERDHAQVVLAYAVATAIGAAAIIAWGLAVSDHWLVRHTAELVLHVPLLLAASFALGALLARRHRQPAAVWLCAAMAALALWGYRAPAVASVMSGDSVSAHRVSAVLEPGYALLRDQRQFLSQTSAWRAATLPASAGSEARDDNDAEDRALPPEARWRGQGLAGARIADPGVRRSLDNDYLAVLIARELGVAGLVQTAALLLLLLLGAGALTSARLPHASASARARLLVVATAGLLVLYQPLAALGILPLTGISWPGMGLDSPADLWLFALALCWLAAPAIDTRRATSLDGPTADERVRTAPRLRQARGAAGVALGACCIAGLAMVARAGDGALARGEAQRRLAGFGDARLDRAIAYARSLRCDSALASLGELHGEPSDAGTARFHAEASARVRAERAALLARWQLPGASEPCAGRAGAWRLTEAEPTTEPGPPTCRATLELGWPQLVVERAAASELRCSIHLPGDAIAQLAARPAAPPPPRVRVVSKAMGDAALDLGEVLIGGAVIRLRRGAPELMASHLPASSGPILAGRLALGDDTALELTAAGVALRGGARLYQAEPGPSAGPRWRAVTAGDALEGLTLVAAGETVALVRPRTAWSPAGKLAELATEPAKPSAKRIATPPAKPVEPDTSSADRTITVDPLLADELVTAGGARRRTYPHGAALPQLGWLNPYSLDRSLGLDGWIHAATAKSRPPPAAACGTLAPPPIDRSSVCRPSALDGVLECRVSLQPELSARLDDVLARVLAAPANSTPPLRAQLVLLRGDTGELLVQRDLAQGRPPSAYAPRTAADERALVRLREDRDPQTGEPGLPGESAAERADWNQPIAVGSVLKPVLARAAELAFPQLAPTLVLGFSGQGAQCKGRRGTFAALAGHCPPTSVAGEPAVADLHDFLARSPNWYQMALGTLGLGLSSGSWATGDAAIALPELLASDLAQWPSAEPLTLRDEAGIILGKRSVSIEGLRRAPLWQAVERVLGRPLCTAGDARRCAAAASRRDVCALRALPLASPSADLRHLIALGPDRYDLYPQGRAGQTYVPTREYLQWLRGGGLHPAGSLSQLTDTFARIVYEPEPSSATAPAQLAASWFPAPPVGASPPWRCQKRALGRTATVRGADGGLCAVLAEGGTAHRALATLFEDPRVALHGGKTGTTDSLAQVARKRESCEAWNRRHTLPDRPATAAAQPGWLACGKPAPDDSLLVLAFSVVTPGQTVPLTLGVALQRSGKGAAARLAPELVTIIADYFDPAR